MDKFSDVPLSLSTYIHIYIERELVVVAAAWRSINREPMMEEEMELRSLGSRARPSESRVCVFGKKKKRRMGDRSKESRACAFFLFQFHLLFFFFFFFFFFHGAVSPAFANARSDLYKGNSVCKSNRGGQGGSRSSACLRVRRSTSGVVQFETYDRGALQSPPSPPASHHFFCDDNTNQHTVRQRVKQEN